MKVYHATGYGRVSNNRQLTMIVAAKSRAEAARLMGVTSSWLAKYGSVTGNAADVALATSKPGVLFVQPAGSFSRDWTEA